MSDDTDRFFGTPTVGGDCPECGGEATVFLSPTDTEKGHIYCHESDCGWIHREHPGIGRYIDTDSE